MTASLDFAQAERLVLTAPSLFAATVFGGPALSGLRSSKI